MRRFIISLAKKVRDMERDAFHHAIQMKKMVGNWHDFLSTTDRAAEDIIVSTVHKRYQSHTILAEESGIILGAPYKKWYIDPLDGTGNFLAGIPFFAISISFWKRGGAVASVVYDPIHAECFSADYTGAYLQEKKLSALVSKPLDKMIVLTEIPPNPQKREEVDRVLSAFNALFWQVRSIRSTGCTALDLAYVAAGRVQACVFSGVSNPWDIAAGGHLVEAAGGVVTTWDGQPWNPESNGIIASSVDGQIALMEIVKSMSV